MPLLCFIGIHHYRQVSLEQFSGEHDWFAICWGNAVKRSRCTRCQRHRTTTVYVERWRP